MTEATAPRSICLLRLSALGDVTHVLPLLRTLRLAWPHVAISWVIGKGEHRLLEGLPGVRFVEFDKKSGIAGMRSVRRQCGERFDVLLQLQVSARANLLSAFIPARRRIGYDRSRAKDGHGLFVNERIADRPGIHVLDAIGSFANRWVCQRDAGRLEPAGTGRGPRLGTRAMARGRNPHADDLAVFQPCAAQLARGATCRAGRPCRGARLADRAVRRAQPARTRDRRCDPRGSMRTRDDVLDLIGKDTLKQLPALLARADLLVTPDSGPMHIANAMGTKVLGLHAATNPQRSGPYSDRRYCVDRYDDAARKYRGKPATALKWGTRIEAEGVMDLITVDDAVAAFERYRASVGG